MKLIISDLDGTLIHKQIMSQQTINTIGKLQEQGHIFTIATGRHMKATQQIVLDLKINYPVICGNGAVIYDFKHDQIIHQELIPNQTVLEIMALCDLKQVDFLIYTTKEIVATKPAKDKLESKIGPYDVTVVSKEELKSYIEVGVIKILVIEENKQVIMNLKDRLSIYDHLYLLQSQPTFLDIGFHLASKGRALIILSNYLGVDPKDTLAIGDQENDISMILEAGIGVAMGDGNDTLKLKADYITAPCDDEGFSKAIDDLVFKNKK